jgi:hypothetical protein
MSMLFRDSFGIYANADIPTRWPGGNSNAGLATSPLPPGSQAGAQIMNVNGGRVVTNNYGNNARLIMGCRVYFTTGSVGYFMGFSQSAGLGSFTTSVVLQRDGAGTYIYTGDSPGTLLATGPVVPTATWNHFELDAIFSTTGGATINVYLNGNATPFISVTGVSTHNATGSAAFLNTPPNATSGSSTNSYYADFYLNNGLGSAPENAAFAPQGLGGMKMAFGISTGPGASSGWTPNGAATIWQCINQIPEDGDTTYASSNTIGQVFMTPFSSLPTMSYLSDVQLSTFARSDGAGPRAYQSGFFQGGSYGYSGVNQALPSTYAYIQDEYPTNPATGIAWSPTDLTTLQFGAQLTV